MKIGALVSIPTIYYHETIEGQPLCGSPYKMLDWKYYGGYAIGAVASGGISYKIKNWLDVFAEAKIIALSYAPLKGKMTRYIDIANGINIVDTLPINETHVNFSNTIESSSNSTPSTTEPSQQLKYHFPFSSWGVNVGVKLNFNKTYYRKHKGVNNGSENK